MQQRKAKVFKKCQYLFKVNNKLKETIVKKNETIHLKIEENENLQFQIELHLIESEKNGTVIKRELNYK